jgi:hypothetical protein
LLLRDHFVREPFGDQLVGRPVGVAGHKLVQQRAAWLGDAGVQQRGRRHHQHTAGALVAGWVQEQAEVAVRHPTGHKDLVERIGAKLRHQLPPGRWAGHLRVCTTMKGMARHGSVLHDHGDQTAGPGRKRDR